jgi:hypothetical protein
MALLRPGAAKPPRPQDRIGHLLRQQPIQTGRLEALGRLHSNGLAINDLQPKRFAYVA